MQVVDRRFGKIWRITRANNKFIYGAILSVSNINKDLLVYGISAVQMLYDLRLICFVVINPLLNGFPKVPVRYGVK